MSYVLGPSYAMALGNLCSSSVFCVTFDLSVKAACTIYCNTYSTSQKEKEKEKEKEKKEKKEKEKEK